MNHKVLLPFRIFAENTGVTRIVAETRAGSFRIRPRRLDCVAALAPGILIYENDIEGEVYLAVVDGSQGRFVATAGAREYLPEIMGGKTENGQERLPRDDGFQRYLRTHPAADRADCQ